MRNKDFQNGQLVRMVMLVGGILLLSYVVMLQTGYAGQNVNNTPTNRQLMITEVYVDFGNNTIDISGLNFDNGGIPKVMLGNYPTPLTLVGTPTASQIVAMLPDVPDGDYLLKISTGQGVINFGSYNLTIGAVGPQGIQGIQGPQGIQGQQGIQGTAGIHCWDLNANGVCNAATEDKNADTLCDVNDCKGPQGPTGPKPPAYPTSYRVDCTDTIYCECTGSGDLIRTHFATCPASSVVAGWARLQSGLNWYEVYQADNSLQKSYVVALCTTIEFNLGIASYASINDYSDPAGIWITCYTP